MDNADAALADLRARGVEAVREVMAVEASNVRSFWVRDNSGNLVEWLA